MFGFFFRSQAPRSFAEAQEADAEAFNRFFGALLDSGTYLAPSPFEAGFVSLAHRPRDIRTTVTAAADAMQRLVAAA